MFAQLTRAYNSQKYGSSEITKIKSLILKDVAVVFSHFEVEAKAPCFSIMIGTDDEDKARAQLDDFYEDRETEIVDLDKLAALIRVPIVTATAYDPVTGKVSVDDSTDLSTAYLGTIFVDAQDNEFPLIGGISNIPGDKFFFIVTEAEVDISSDGEIKSSIHTEDFEIRGVTGDTKLIIGVHAKDALITKYLYVLLKYFLLSRKKDLISRGFYCISYSGSDFNKDQDYLADKVYTRFLTMSGKIDDTWRSDQVVLIDQVIINGTPVE